MRSRCVPAGVGARRRSVSTRAARRAPHGSCDLPPRHPGAEREVVAVRRREGARRLRDRPGDLGVGQPAARVVRGGHVDLGVAAHDVRALASRSPSPRTRAGGTPAPGSVCVRGARRPGSRAVERRRARGSWSAAASPTGRSRRTRLSGARALRDLVALRVAQRVLRPTWRRPRSGADVAAAAPGRPADPALDLHLLARPVHLAVVEDVPAKPGASAPRAPAGCRRTSPRSRAGARRRRRARATSGAAGDGGERRASPGRRRPSRRGGARLERERRRPRAAGRRRARWPSRRRARRPRTRRGRSASPAPRRTTCAAPALAPAAAARARRARRVAEPVRQRLREVDARLRQLVRRALDLHRLGQHQAARRRRRRARATTFCMNVRERRPVGGRHRVRAHLERRRGSSSTPRSAGPRPGRARRGRSARRGTARREPTVNVSVCGAPSVWPNASRQRGVERHLVGRAPLATPTRTFIHCPLTSTFRPGTLGLDAHHLACGTRPRRAGSRTGSARA